MRHGKLGAFLLTILVTAPIALAQEPQSAEATDASRCPDRFFMQGVGEVCPHENGFYEVFAPDGRSLGFTHGPDPICEGCPDAAPLSGPDLVMTGGTSVHCVAGNVGEYYIRVIYARAFDDTDRYATMAGTIRNLVGQANAMVDDAAIATGDRLSLRVKCAGGVVAVDNVVLPTGRTAATYASVISDLEDMGYTDGRVKHWVYYDDASACSCAGIGHIYSDDSDSVGNLNNGNGQAMFAISFDSPSVRTMLHELGHNMGATQVGAPRNSGTIGGSNAGHCTDGRDTMCYNDGGSNSGQCQPDFQCSGVCSVEVFDCNKDTYCHANPAPGSYLDTHWQVCHRQNRFIAYGENTPPIMTALSCAPAPSQQGETVTCSFSASDPNTGVHYDVSWGDGATTRVPTTGTVAPGTMQTASYAFPSQGDKTITVQATDNGGPPLTSQPLSLVQHVLPPNEAPVPSILSCEPAAPAEGQVVTCSFSSSDADNVRYQVLWGDGSAEVRVPASGHVPAASVQSASHVYSRGGAFSFSITVTDDGGPPMSGTASTTITVTEVNTAPVMTALNCAPTLLRPGESVSCTFSATDDTSGIRYEVAWGDGATTMVPASGCTSPGGSHSSSHVYNAQADVTISVRAVDCFTSPAASAPLTRAVRILGDIAAPSLTIDDPRLGMMYRGCGQQASKVTGLPLFIERGCVRATATDPSGIARVEVRQGSTLLATDTVAPYEMEFDIPLFQQGVEYQVRAIDNFGFVANRFFNADTIGG